MLVTAVGRVRQFLPEAAIVIFSYSPKQDRALLTDPAVTVINSGPAALVFAHFLGAVLLKLGLPSSQAAKALRRCDVLLDVSGIAFADGREKTLPFNILNMWPALLLNVPVVRLSQALGPFSNPLTRLASTLFLQRSTHLFTRGAQTTAFVRELGIPENKWSPAPDVAFLYESRFSLSNEHVERVRMLSERLATHCAAGQEVVGLIPSSLVYQKCEAAGIDYLRLFTQLMTTQPETTRFVVLPNATREGRDTPYNNDLYVIERLREHTAAACPPDVLDRIEWVDYDMNTAGSREVLAVCDFVLTSRFHGMISALSLGKPLIVVGWSHKYAEVMAQFGLADYVIDYADRSLDLTRSLNNLRDEGAVLKHKLAAALEDTRAASARQFAYLETLLQ